MISSHMIPPTNIVNNSRPLAAQMGIESNHSGRGLLGGSGSRFDDLVIVNQGFKKIKGVTGYYCEKRMVGVEFHYQLVDGRVITTSHNARSNTLLSATVGVVLGGKIHSQHFQIPEGDYIYSIECCANAQKMFSLAFQTYKGLRKDFGVPRTTKGAMMFRSRNPGYSFGPAKGGYHAKHLDWLVFPVVTVPENMNIELPLGMVHNQYVGYNPTNTGMGFNNQPNMGYNNQPNMGYNNQPNMGFNNQPHQNLGMGHPANNQGNNGGLVMGVPVTVEQKLKGETNETPNQGGFLYPQI